MAWNEFFPEQEIQVAKIACQDSADLFFFFYAAGILRCEFVPKGTTVNNHYLGVMERLYAHMRHVRNEQFRNSIKTRPLIARRMCFQIYLCYTAASLHP